MAQREPLITWLYLLQDASGASWEPVWYGAIDGVEGFSSSPYRVVLRRQLTSTNQAAFDAARAVLESYKDKGSTLPLTKPVQSCAATPAEFALWSVQVLEGLRASRGEYFADLVTDLPAELRAVAATQTALDAVYGDRWQTVAERRARLDWAASMTPSPEIRAWVNVGRTYLAGSVADLIRVTADAPLDARTLRALNVLSVVDLRQFVEAQTRPADQMQSLLIALAAREFMLGDLPAARRHLTQLASDPDHPLPDVAAALAAGGPAQTAVARAILALDAPTVWLTGGQIYHLYDDAISYRNANRPSADLPIEFQYAGFLDRDLNAWLLQDYGAYRGMHGYSVESLARLYSRVGKRWSPHEALTFRPSSPSRDLPFPFVKLIAAGELQDLGRCNGLTLGLSKVILNWADRGSDTWLERHLFDQTEMADGLRRAILLNKRNPGALVDGRPAGQRAFALLSTRFADSPAAQATKYWYHTDQGCQP